MEKNDFDTNDEYIFEINDKSQLIKKNNKSNNQEINIIFENVEQTNIINNVLNLLSEYYIEDLLNYND